MIRRRKAPVRQSRDGFVIDLGPEESDLVLRLLDELRDLLTESGSATDGEGHALLARLFPVVHPQDEQAEAEYQRYMRDDLVQSKLAAIARVEELLGDRQGGRPQEIDEARVIAFMQAVNSIRLVLGTMLGVTDDPDIDEVADGVEDSPEYHLYAYLSWLLEHTVRALSGA